MHTLTIDIVGRAIFGTELADEAGPIGQAVTQLQDATILASVLASGISPTRLRSLATGLVPKLGAAAGTLESLVNRIIDDRLGAPHPEPRDLLDLLITCAGMMSP